MRVINQTGVVLGLPRVGPVPPKQERDIPDAVAQNKVVAAWLGKGMLEVVSGSAPKNPKQEAAPDEADEKQAMIDELAGMGIYRDKRTSVANLRATLEEARAEKGAPE